LSIQKKRLYRQLASIPFLLFAGVLFFILIEETGEGLGFDWLTFFSGMIMLGLSIFLILD